MMQVDKSEFTYCMSPALVMASNGIKTLVDMRVSRMAAAKLFAKPPSVNGSLTYSITASEYAQVFGVELSDSYTQLKVAAGRLSKAKATIKHMPDGVTPRPADSQSVQWFTRAEYVSGASRIEFTFSKDMAEYVHPRNQFRGPMMGWLNEGGTE